MFVHQRIRIYKPDTCPPYFDHQWDELNNCGLKSAQWLLRNELIDTSVSESFGTVAPEGEAALEFLTPRAADNQRRRILERDFDCTSCGMCVRLEYSPLGAESFVLAEPDQGSP